MAHQSYCYNQMNSMNNLQSIFEKAGLTINAGRFQKTGKELTLQFIKSPDGSIRWMWPAHSTKPLFLKFYNISTVKAQLFAQMIQLIFKFKLQQMFFSEIQRLPSV